MVTGSPRRGIRYTLQPPRSWLGRAAFILAVTALAALAFFFLVVFVVVGAMVASVVLVRWWWLLRKARRTQAASSIEGEYVIVKTAEDTPGGGRTPGVPPVAAPRLDDHGVDGQRTGSSR